MCVGVELVHNELALLDAGALLELSLCAIRSCCYDHSLTDLTSNQHLSAHRHCLSISQHSSGGLHLDRDLLIQDG